MYTLVAIQEELASNSITQVRKDGFLVRRLLKENAIFAKKIYKKTCREQYCFYFLLDYEEGDYLCFEVFSVLCGRYTYTIELNNEYIQNVSNDISNMCKGIIEVDSKFPKNFEKLLKEVLPIVFKKMTEGNSQEARIFERNYSWILKHMNKNICDYVSEEEINAYIAEMIARHELALVKQFTNNQGFKMSEKNELALKKAKSKIAEVIRTAKKVFLSKYQSGIIMQKDEIVPNDPNEKQVFIVYVGYTSCGHTWLKIEYLLENWSVFLCINNSVNLIADVKLNISKSCKDIIAMLQKENLN